MHNGKKTENRGEILLSNFDSIKKGTYGFQFSGPHQQRVAGISSVGWEKWKNTTYDWDGLNRGESDIIIFQYTLKGRGEIIIDDHVHTLEAGSAFLVKVPSKHRYYLPHDSDGWEFIHLTLFGMETMAAYNSITKKAGQILELDFLSNPITKIISILNTINAGGIKDAYEASSLAFTFLMELERYILYKKDETTWPESIAKAILFIDNNFSKFITLDDIVETSGLSKYHFTRIFHKNVLSTPIQYLTKRRISESIILLKDQKLTIDEIASKVGFSNGNYFIKVFKKMIGVPPGEYRDSRSFISVDQMIID